MVALFLATGMLSTLLEKDVPIKHNDEDATTDENQYVFSATSLRAVLNMREHYSKELPERACFRNWRIQLATVVNDILNNKTKCLQPRPIQFSLKLKECLTPNLLFEEKLKREGWTADFQVEDVARECVGHMVGYCIQDGCTSHCDKYSYDTYGIYRIQEHKRKD
jgi:hypothetical protein